MATAKPVALVTGGANGIGRAIAHHLLAAGWRVGIIDRPGSGLKRAFSSRDRNVALIEGDVRDEGSISRAVKMFVAQFGRLDAVVSNAGIMIRKPLRRLTFAEWHRVIDTNLTAAFLLARAAERPLRKARPARLLPHDFATLFPAVVDCQEDSATQILASAGAELARLASVVICRLFPPSSSFESHASAAAPASVPVAMAGGVFRHAALVCQIFYNQVRWLDPGVQVQQEVVDPVEGALRQARRM